MPGGAFDGWCCLVLLRTENDGVTVPEWVAVGCIPRGRILGDGDAADRRSLLAVVVVVEGLT